MSRLLTCSVDWNNAAVILQYWFPTSTVPIWAWYIIFWVVFSVITTLGVGFYGEIEYFFGMFKFISLAVLFFISILANVGAFGNGYVGFRYWGEPYGLLLFLFNSYFHTLIYIQVLYGTESTALAKSSLWQPHST
jgi:yeast amino acid transporter